MAAVKIGGRSFMNGTQRSNIKPGMRVRIVRKQDQNTGKLTEGIVKDLLTKSATHPRGIKVRLEDGQIGRVKEIVVEPCRSTRKRAELSLGLVHKPGAGRPHCYSDHNSSTI